MLHALKWLVEVPTLTANEYSEHTCIQWSICTEGGRGEAYVSFMILLCMWNYQFGQRYSEISDNCVLDKPAFGKSALVGLWTG